MNLIVTDSGFHADDWGQGFLTLAGVAAGAGNGAAIDVAPEDDLAGHRAILVGAALIRVAFAGFADGRGFTTARRLRLLGFGGRLRAGPGLIADQYAMARRSGFDEVEIPETLARRQPEAQWLARADWRAYDHQSRLRG